MYSFVSNHIFNFHKRHDQLFYRDAALFERLDHAALAAQRRLTVPFLRQVLGA